MSPKPSAPTARVVAAAATLLLLGSVGGIQAGRVGASFMRDLEIAQPALANIAPWTDDYAALFPLLRGGKRAIQTPPPTASPSPMAVPSTQP